MYHELAGKNQKIIANNPPKLTISWRMMKKTKVFFSDFHLSHLVVAIFLEPTASWTISALHLFFDTGQENQSAAIKTYEEALANVEKQDCGYLVYTEPIQRKKKAMEKFEQRSNIRIRLSVLFFTPIQQYVAYLFVQRLQVNRKKNFNAV
ncbi:hypothetical protein BDA99DRAFT_541689 [Phascolomyces articulosus]|uniref:Uncharacterized protein n=1 Tax=Phascolomyces articulosus TaxID=60185 RepID=A0AAD5JR10_9FUNG|nr:hypothetical protein BDA99DRAFT_541689 [Phascolomyces articulosus]